MAIKTYLDNQWKAKISPLFISQGYGQAKVRLIGKEKEVRYNTRYIALIIMSIIIE